MWVVDVYDAVRSRRAVRAFTHDPVPRTVLQRVLSAARRAPSGANLQPWRSYVVDGISLTDLKRRTAARVAAGDPGDAPEYEMYPPDLGPPYAERRSDAAARRYALLGIPRDDRCAREKAVAANWNCFGAPTALFCYIDRRMGPPQWADVGMYLQTVMLLFRAEGLHSCPQMAWSVYHRTVADVVEPADDLILFCGLSIGYEDSAAPSAHIDRAPLAETITFIDREPTDSLGTGAQLRST